MSGNNNNNGAFPGGFPGFQDQNDFEPNPAANNNTRSFTDTLYARVPFLRDISTNAMQSEFASLQGNSKLIFIFQWIMYLPVLLTYKVSSMAFVILVKLFPIVRRLTQNRLGRRSEPHGIDPAQTARNFAEEFKRYYGDQPGLDFYEGGYTGALYLAKRDARFLMVYLHSDEHHDSKEFINTILLQSEFQAVLKAHNILFWAGDVVNSESYQVSNTLNVTKYPFLALLALKSNTQETPQGTTTTTPTLSVCTRVQGLTPLNKVLRRLTTQINKLEPSLIVIRTERQQQELSRMIRLQQDQAYEATLAKDRERERVNADKALLKKNKEQWLRWRLSQLKPENKNKDECARIAIRLPSGKRIQRFFDKSCPVEELYAFVELHLQGLIDQQAQGPVEKPQGFKYIYDFRLISMIPREEVKCDLEAKIEEAGAVIYPNGNLVVELIDEVEEE